ncbi:PREDICTED: non-specific lipid-transfer protein 3-like [Erythranthe guttata]|uniref:non-specific lipid-transfer protein 3-like n=1 Tax=Erythranthe guttata TaxID=4155 RepID=UPI00064DA25E|nr:PREDICTED: non-specific lipid-transfer protein 3-like [Erythranthe guttata]|eukprot:XP_012848413.1 PREDICTED: non-specific lipid-transfer protein 3-like [Erythranthe guttata]
MGLVLLVAIIFRATHANANANANANTKIPCLEAITKISPCEDYLAGKAKGVTAACCNGARSLIPIIPPGIKPGDLCPCFMMAKPGFNILPDRADALPGLFYTDLPPVAGVVGTDNGATSAKIN